MSASKGYLAKFEAKKIFFFLTSFIIVAFGTPAWSKLLCPIASAIGFGLFWFSINSIRSKKKRFYVSFVWYFFVQAVHLSWLTAIQYQGLYILGVYIGIILWMGAQFGVLNFWTSSSSFNVKKAFFIASVWTLIELSRLLVFCGFAFNPTGLSLCYSAVPSQFLSVFGVYGMTFLVVFTCLIFYLFLLSKRKKHFLLWVVLCLFPYIFGIVHLTIHKKLQAKNQNPPVQVALVQTGLSPAEKIPINGFHSQFVPLYNQWWKIFTYIKEHKKSQLDYIILPEVAVPFGMKEPLYPLSETLEILRKLFGDQLDKILPKKEAPYCFDKEGKWFVSNAFWAQILSNAYQAEVIVGFDDTDPLIQKNYNAAFHFVPFENSISRYEKRILVPLAEYLPLPFLKPLVASYGISGHATHGKEAKVFGKKANVSTSICYEECYGHLMREGRKKGANLYVNITNDAWYLPSKLPVQHYFHGKLRSIENGVDVLRACNTGVTGIINSLGEDLAIFEDLSSKSQYEKGALVSSFIPYSYQTLYTFWGDSFIFYFSSLIVVVYMYLFWRKKRSKIELSY